MGINLMEEGDCSRNDHSCSLMVLSSVGEVQFGLVQSHFRWTRDQIVRSQKKFLGLGPGLPGTVELSLALVQTWCQDMDFSEKCE